MNNEDALLNQERSSARICMSDRESWSCRNMKEVDGDLDMSYEHYKCKVCGRTMTLDYEEMR